MSVHPTHAEADHRDSLASGGVGGLRDQGEHLGVVELCHRGESLFEGHGLTARERLDGADRPPEVGAHAGAEVVEERSQAADVGPQGDAAARSPRTSSAGEPDASSVRISG